MMHLKWQDNREVDAMYDYSNPISATQRLHLFQKRMLIQERVQSWIV